MSSNERPAKTATAAQTGTRRERRIQRQRKVILDAAAELFAQRGYMATTTKDIAQAVDIGESTLYGYFSGKQQILNEILIQQGEMVDSLLVHLNDLQGLESFVDLTDLLLERLLDWAVYNRVVIAEAWINDEILLGFVVVHWHPIMERLERFISTRVASGVFRPLDPGFGARMMVAAFVASILPVLRGVEPPPTPEQRHQLAADLVELINNGFHAQKG
ncbi:MAG TPA: helix-turn-helix domain-containing protein [Longilinea sp.]|nr:helix-turn-helix domain-containing protein [Longilinea sp.]